MTLREVRETELNEPFICTRPDYWPEQYFTVQGQLSSTAVTFDLAEVLTVEQTRNWDEGITAIFFTESPDTVPVLTDPELEALPLMQRLAFELGACGKETPPAWTNKILSDILENFSKNAVLPHLHSWQVAAIICLSLKAARLLDDDQRSQFFALVDIVNQKLIPKADTSISSKITSAILKEI